MLLPGSTRPGLSEAFRLGLCKGQGNGARLSTCNRGGQLLARARCCPAGLEVRLGMISTHHSDHLEDSGLIQTHLDRDEGWTRVRADEAGRPTPAGAP